MLPVMEREFSELRNRIRKLQGQHEEVKAVLQSLVLFSKEMRVERPDTIVTVRDLVAELATSLEAHLDLEEETLFPYFLSMDRDWHLG